MSSPHRRFIEVSSPYSDDPCYIDVGAIVIVGRNKFNKEETIIACRVGMEKVLVYSDEAPEDIIAAMRGEE